MPSFVLTAILSLFAFGPALAGDRITANSQLDRVADAVDGAESSHGRDISMWRPETAGPQGPMQVSEKAAIDVGGGDRFEIAQNRAIGRAYLALLYRRYGNWADAISAYNWGLGKVDSWIRGGRRPESFANDVSRYLRRVLNDSGLCDGGAPTANECNAQGSSAGAVAWPLVGNRSVLTGTYRSFDRTLAKAEMLAARFGAEQTDRRSGVLSGGSRNAALP
jgi:Transglycosylase SLT domain